MLGLFERSDSADMRSRTVTQAPALSRDRMTPGTEGVRRG